MAQLQSTNTQASTTTTSSTTAPSGKSDILNAISSEAKSYGNMLNIVY